MLSAQYWDSSLYWNCVTLTWDTAPPDGAQLPHGWYARSSPHPSALFRPCLRLSERVPARFVTSKPPQTRLEAVLTRQNGPGRARTVANRAGTALTGAMRTGTCSEVTGVPPGWTPPSRGGRCGGQPPPRAWRAPGAAKRGPDRPFGAGGRWPTRHHVVKVLPSSSTPGAADAHQRDRVPRQEGRLQAPRSGPGPR